MEQMVEERVEFAIVKILVGNDVNGVPDRVLKTSKIERELDPTNSDY
jgi:hypothetical protein